MSIFNNRRCSSSHRYSLPKYAGDLCRLGQLFGSSCAMECAAIVERHNGLVMLIAPDKYNAQRLHNEIQQFTDQKVTTIPDWETQPYDDFSPDQKIISSRLSSLYQLPTMMHGVIIVSVNTLMQRVCPHEFLCDYMLVLQKGQHLSCDRLRNQLESAGYRSVTQVMDYGEFATRSAILDFYPMGSPGPYRIHFLHDKIHSLRTFKVETQRTQNDINVIHLLPAHEFPTDKNAIELFRRQWRKQFNISRDPKNIYQQVSRGAWPNGIEYWQPLFFSQPLSSLFSYLPKNTLIINTDNLESAATRVWHDISRFYKSRHIDPMRPLLIPDTMWLRVDALFSLLKTWPRIALETVKLPTQMDAVNLGYYALPDLMVRTQSKLPVDNLNRFLATFKGSVIFSVKTDARLRPLRDLLSSIKLHPLLIQHFDQVQPTGKYIMVGACEHGFFDSICNLVLICESDLLGERISHCQESNHSIINTDVSLLNLSDLHAGQPVVHVEHGVGRYAGLIRLDIGGIQAEYLILAYAGEDKLYVPVSSLHLISRYAGSDDENAPLHKLGGGAWVRAKEKAAERARDIAVELLDIYSQRVAKKGFSFKHNHEKYQLFCQTFDFETTPDQQQAINAVLSDMCQPLAMDRLVCGDVGFGKTEVAMRAAFLAVENSKQVAVLVPTTLLAQQHFYNFCNRFAAWPITIEMLSRFRSAKEQQKVLNAAATGKVDIIIGTHKLLQADLRWRDLGLLIVDEEHRFGVCHKELIKAIRSDVDILTLTATPIPRTLNMAMSGLRDLSIIATPPLGRLAVKTIIRKYDAIIVREAILSEVLRGGQVYYLYNDVENIVKVAQQLAELVPEARVAIAHGQMRERDLEQVMNDFYHQRINVLVCTTIIETGLDVASANTIIIERADRFGIAQLHQLRGRVRRSHHQAYAYMLTPNHHDMSVDAQKRLKAIASLEDLGAGFALATHDLEIRGAGELLGAEQSGQMITIGFSLYMEFLEKSVEALKNGREPSLEDLTSNQTEVELRMPTMLPEEFVPDVNTRLTFYKRIASAKNDNELAELQAELIDRFGPLPEPARYLLYSAALRQQAQTLCIKRIEVNEYGGFIMFDDNDHVEPDYLIKLLQNTPQVYRLDGPRKLKFVLDLSNYQKRLMFIKNLLNDFLVHKLILPV